MLLKNELIEIEHLIPEFEQSNPKISSSGVAWHLDHTLKVLITVSEKLKESDPSTYTWQFNALRHFIYTFNFIPRGKGRAPKHVLPPENIRKEEIQAQLELAKKELNTLVGMHPKSNFKHPYFGILNLKMTKKFLRIHTQHHLKICRDIIK